MRISKDIETFLKSLKPRNKNDKIVASISQCSENDDGIAMVNNKNNAYNFDNIVKALFKGDFPTSVDCIYIKNGVIDFIEFKDGVIDRYEKEYIEPDYTCQECKKLHKESFENFKKARKHQKKVLNQNLQMKASESLLVLQNCILPYCKDCEDLSTQYDICFICVYKIGDIEPLDEYELGLEDLAAPASNISDSDPQVSKSINKQLSKYSNEDINHKHPFYEHIHVYSNLEFQAMSRYN